MCQDSSNEEIEKSPSTHCVRLSQKQHTLGATLNFTENRERSEIEYSSSSTVSYDDCFVSLPLN